MPLPTGTRIGPYEVTGALGEGGMGEVYRARDLRLDRDVALKLLIESFARDPDLLARFDREAKLLASLNHPHIAQIYGIEGDGSSRALVMELVEGPTLADRIARGALPPEEALAVARQIAGALEAAHEQGIIHRDLKPANIKLRADGAVKVLDFGLAKFADAAPGSSAGSALTSPGMTRAGLVVGTPAYMSPEQARGQAVDARTDIWAFGCVCYEMLTGQRTFSGDTASDAISSVLTRDPDWTALPRGTPPPVRRLLRRCLTRDLTRRLRHAGDVRLELDELATNEFIDGGRAPATDRTTRRAMPWAIASIAALAALAFGWAAWRATNASAANRPPTVRLELSLPPNLELFPSTSHTATASPDGNTVAFVGTSGGTRQMYVRRLDAFNAEPVRGTVGATTASFSADGTSLIFVTSGGELKTVSLADGLVTIVAKDASLLYGLTPAADNQIVFIRSGTLWTVPASGGTPRQLTTLATGERNHAWPSALPGGRMVLFTVESVQGQHIEAIPFDGGDRRVVLSQAARAKVGPEHRLFFYRDNRLLSAAFDQSTLTVNGAPLPVLDNVANLGSGIPMGDVSPSGLMVFPPDAPRRRLVWVSREGAEEPVSDVPRSYMNPRLSPDGTRIVMQAGDIWVHDLRRNVFELVPTIVSAANAFPMWLSDGSTIIHRSGLGLVVQSTETGAAGKVLAGTTEFDYPAAVTADGKTLVLMRSSPASSFDVMVAPVDDATRAAPLVQSPAYESGARLSPDGRWLVYVSNESGQNEIHVRPFQGADRRRQVSRDGGSQPAWNPNGREIFYRIGDRMMAVQVTPAGNELQLSAPQQLFARAYAYGAGITIANYDVDRDGRRFIMVSEDTSLGRLRVILNWRADSTPAPAQPQPSGTSR